MIFFNQWLSICLFFLGVLCLATQDRNCHVLINLNNFTGSNKIGSSPTVLPAKLGLAYFHCHCLTNIFFLVHFFGGFSQTGVWLD